VGLVRNKLWCLHSGKVETLKHGESFRTHAGK
jgi:hypothetical protein